MSLPSEPWIVIQETDLNDYLVGAQATALKTAALAAGQENTWTTIMTDVVNRIRSEMRSSPRNVVSETPLTIPPDLKSTAMVLIVEALQRRIPSLKLSESQKDAADQARDYLKRIARGEVVITAPPDPLTPDDQQRGTPAVVVRADRKIATGRNLRGL
jgi:hypothetical protein